MTLPGKSRIKLQEVKVNKPSYFIMETERRLRKAISDVSHEMEKHNPDLERRNNILDAVGEVKQAECLCCGIKEDCTEAYIKQIQEYHSGNWVCGLCSEAVKERLVRAPNISIQEAMSSQREFCQNYSNTVRLNPKLSLTFEMRNIAKRVSQKRNSKNSAASTLARSTSCFPRIDLKQ